MSVPRTTQLVEINVGYSAHGQKAVLLGGRDATGRWSWSLRHEARTHRDQAVQIDGLTAEMIRQMHEAVERDGR